MICLCNVGTSNPGRLADEVADIYLEGQFPADQKTTATPAANVDPRPFIGLYRDADSHSVYKIGAVDNDLTLFGQSLKAIGPGRFASSSGSELSFESRAGGGMRATMASPDTAPHVLDRFQPIKVLANDLAQYAGMYVSEELETSYKFAPKEGSLSSTINWQEPMALEPSVRDEFQAPIGATVVFRRDASKRVIGCELYAGRVRNVYFRRTGSNRALTAAHRNSD